MDFLLDHWQFVIVFGTLIFNIGYNYNKFKSFISKSEASEMVTKEVNKAIANHCPFEDTVKTLSADVVELKTWRVKHSKWGGEQNERNHLILQELALNMKNVCEKIGITYLRNGK